jgi:hypothetical protein
LVIDAQVDKKGSDPAAGGRERKGCLFAAELKDGKGIFVTTDRESEFRRLYIDLPAGSTAT